MDINLVSYDASYKQRVFDFTGKCFDELGKKFGVPTPIIDSMITIASAMVGTDFYKTGVTLEDLDIGHMDKEQLLEYLNKGTYTEK